MTFPTSQGSITAPQTSDGIVLNGRQSKVIVADYTFGASSHVLYSTASIFFGGVLLSVGGLGEFLLGNTFPCLVFFSYGAHFFTYAFKFVPWFGTVAWNATPEPGNSFSPGPTFAAGFGDSHLLCIGW